MRLRCLQLFALLTGMAHLPASAATFSLDKVPDVVAPSTRGSANTTWFGWETFNEADHRAEPINDSTPDIGTTSVGANFQTTNGEDHVTGGGNLYVAVGTLAEQVTVPTSGTAGTGFTTIIAQFVTAFGDFPGPITLGSINGVAPTVVRGFNSAGKGQVWAKWQIPGNAASYTFTIAGPAGVTNYSFDRFVVDTLWSATAYQEDTALITPPLTASIDKSTDVLVPSTRGNYQTTYFGWETFNESDHRAEPIDDSTPDIGNTAIVGANFKTTNGEDHVTGSGNLYVAAGTLAEQVTVPTNGTVGVDGYTTVIAQFITAFGDFPGAITLGSIGGVSPTVVHSVNSVGKGQFWAKWQVPGNAASYTFTISGPAGVANFSFDRFVVDTSFSSSAQPDTVLAATPSLTSVMDKLPGLVVPSTRSLSNTTWFGWETFSDANGTFTGVINDSTPDIGTTATGVNFKTTNGQVHELGSGNIYFFAGTLAEQVTVATNGTVGTDGFTTIIFQIESAQPPAGFTGAFSDVITLSSIEDIAPTVVQSVNSTGAGHLWAKWKIPGNKASYTFTIAGPANTPHFSFERVVVDTFFSTAGYQGDTMIATNLNIAATSLPAAKIGTAYTPVTFAASEGTSPYTWDLSAGALPDGLTLSTAGVLTGTPTVTGTFNFTVRATDHLENTATQALSIHAAAPVVISTSSLAGTLKDSSYNASLAATGGTAPYSWIKSAGDLPAGLSLSTAGVISGTATAGGSFSFTVEVTDANGFTDTKALQITVATLSISTPSPLIGGVKGLNYSATFAASGGSGALVWSLETGSVLPAGLVFSPAGVLSGKPTVAVSNAAFTVKVTDGSATVTKAFALTVTATYLAPVMSPPTLGTVNVGTLFTYQLSASNYPKTFNVTGLPPGITYAAATGLISGRPTTAGAFTVKVKATNTGGTSPVISVPIVVKALPNTLVGSFTGLVSRHAANSNLGAILSLSTTPTGAFTAKVTVGATAKTFTGFLTAANASQINVTLTGHTLILALDSTTNLLSGSYDAAPVSGWRSVWNAATNPPVTRQGYYSMGIEQTVDDGLVTTPHGSGYATFTVAPAGTLTVVGKTADGQVISTAGSVGPTGQIAVHTSQYANLGSIHGTLVLTEDPDEAFSENVVSGPLTWVKPTTTGHTYPAAFSLDLSAYGKYLAHTTVGAVEVLGLPDTGTANLVFEDGGLGSTSVIDPDVTGFTYTEANTVVMPTAGGINNPGKAVLTIAKATGLVGGSFTLVDTAPALTRKVTFQGQIVRPEAGNARAVGYFLLQQRPAAGLPISTSAILSGKVSIQQQQP